jgi:SAM-dependent MidA family methyltransferase
VCTRSTSSLVGDSLRHGCVERLVDFDDDDTGGGDGGGATGDVGGPGAGAPRYHFRMVLAPGPTPASIAYAAAERAAAARRRPGAAPVGPPPPPPVHAEGDVAEYCPAGVKLAHGMAARLGTDGGAALIIDYGGVGSGAWTLRGIRRHAFVPPLEAPGDVDLSADVDFAALAAAAEEDGAAHAHGPVAQGEFLGRMGLSSRLERLTAAADAATRSRLVGEARRLVDPAEMGAVYKVLALTPAAGRGRLVPPAF